MLVEVVEVEGGTVACGRSIQGLSAHEQSGRFIQVDGVGKGGDEVREADVDAVAGEVAVVGQGVHHRTRASNCGVIHEVSHLATVILMSRLGQHSRSVDVGACQV